MLDVIKSRGLPLDRIITFDIWATDTILAEFPEVTEFKNKVDFYIKGKYGIEVEHLCARYPNGEKITYENSFYRINESGKRKGEIWGFPMMSGNWCNSQLKIKARKGAVKKGDVEYVGIAFDEKKRHKKISEIKVAPLVDFEIDEELCGLHCYYEGILSPTYNNSFRDGCWFCHNQGVNQLRHLRKKHKELWELLLKWDKDSPITFRPDGHTVHDFDRRFQLEDDGLIFPEDSFRWCMLDQPFQIRMNF